MVVTSPRCEQAWAAFLVAPEAREYAPRAPMAMPQAHTGLLSAQLSDGMTWGGLKHCTCPTPPPPVSHTISSRVSSTTTCCSHTAPCSARTCRGWLWDCALTAEKMSRRWSLGKLSRSTSGQLHCSWNAPGLYLGHHTTRRLSSPARTLCTACSVPNGRHAQSAGPALPRHTGPRWRARSDRRGGPSSTAGPAWARLL